MRHLVREKVIVNIEYYIELDELTDPAVLLKERTRLQQFIGDDYIITPFDKEIEETIVSEIYEEGETEYPKWTWEKGFQLTVDMLKFLPQGTTIGYGVCVNSPDDVYMTNERKGHQMNWVAVTGGAHDWVIYVGWLNMTLDEVRNNGEKITTEKYIRKLVPCTDEAYYKYRH